jgi:hypothetical protein
MNSIVSNENYSKAEVGHGGRNFGDIVNLTCADGYIMNTELSQVQITCDNSTKWLGHWGIIFNDNGTTIPNSRFLKSSDPFCVETEPAYFSQLTCETGCLAGNCGLKNETIGEFAGFKCSCLDGHSGFHCKKIPSTIHQPILGVMIPLVLLLIGGAFWYWRRTQNNFISTALINEESSEDMQKHNQNPLPWETDENTKQNSKFLAGPGKKGDNKKTSFRPVNIEF